MLGSKVIAVVAALLQTKKYSLTLLHRGNQYWDYNTRISPFVKFVQFNRKKINECKFLDSDQTFDAVIDFSGYKKKYLTPIVKKLKKKIRLYVYISTDSVYEVCDFKTPDDGTTDEKCSLRPTDPAKKRKFSKRDSYGHEKLECEEYLQSHLEVPYLFLRLADVIGPRDNTGRFPCLWLTTQYTKDYDIPCSDSHKQVSLVYSIDVARFVNFALENNLKNEVFNIACSEKPSLEILVKMVAGNRDVSFSRNSELGTYPSVERGPIDVSKLLRTGFKLTPLKVALEQSCGWYLETWRNGQCLPELLEQMEELKDDLRSNAYMPLSQNIQATFFTNNLKVEKKNSIDDSCSDSSS